MNIEFLQEFILFYMNDKFLIPFAIFGYLIGKNKIFINTFLIAFLALVINAYLKQIWQIPLNLVVGKIGWSYPSGHTSFNIVFWGSLCVQLMRKRLIVASVMLMIFGTISMEGVGYHDWVDIFGGVCLGLLILVPFYYINKYLKNETPLYWGLFLQGICLYMLFFMFDLSLLQYNWLFITQGMMSGILLLEYLKHTEKIVIKLNPRHSLFNLCTSLIILQIILIDAFSPHTDYLFAYLRGVGASLAIFMLVPKLSHISHQLIKTYLKKSKISS